MQRFVSSQEAIEGEDRWTCRHVRRDGEVVAPISDRSREPKAFDSF